MFKSREELERHVSEEYFHVSQEPEKCYICGKYLVDQEGYIEYYGYEDYYDQKFCSENCIVDYLISMGYVEEDE